MLPSILLFSTFLVHGFSITFRPNLAPQLSNLLSFLSGNLHLKYSFLEKPWLRQVAYNFLSNIDIESHINRVQFKLQASISTIGYVLFTCTHFGSTFLGGFGGRVGNAGDFS